MEKHNRIYTQIRCIFFTHSQKMFPKDHFRLLACQYILKYHKHSKLFYTQKRIMWPRITWNVFYKTWLLTGQVISYAIHNFRMTIIATGTEEYSVGSSFTVLHFMNDPGYLRRRKEDMFSFPFICLFVCLFVCLAVCEHSQSKSIAWIFMKYLPSVPNHKRKSKFNFGWPR